ncbi:MAG: hypothetical protein GKB99_01965 [Methanocellales archaeon]|nr:hypothetical protein [Methanocellales archaeon]
MGRGVAAGAGVADNAGAVLVGTEGAGVGSGSETHPKIQIIARTPASAKYLRSLLTLIFIFNNC